MGFPNSFESIDSEGVAFTDLHYLIVSLDLRMDLPFRMILFQ
jgi:Fe-S-cluster formation regulator IscX/YfhJ